MIDIPEEWKENLSIAMLGLVAGYIVMLVISLALSEMASVHYLLTRYAIADAMDERRRDA